MNKHKQFKKILDDDEIKNSDFVKEYLKFSFDRRRAEKDMKLYINICKIYNSYPDTIKELLDNIPTLGYYKDYFHIYNLSKSTELNQYILDLVVKQIKIDITNLKENKEISTVGKFLPRENSKLNKNNSFIDAFCKVLYPGMKIESAKKKYRKLKTLLNAKLGTLESLLCTQQLEKINLNKVSPMALEKNKQALLGNDITRAKLDQYETELLKKLSLASFIKELLLNKHSIDKMQDLWDHNRYCMEIPFIYRLISNSVCIVDLSKDTFSSETQFFALGIALLIDQFSLVKNKTMVCNDTLVNLQGNILEKANQLLTLCGPCKELNAEKLYETVKINNKDSYSEVKNLVFVSTKQLTNYEILADKKITLIHYVPKYDNFNIKYFNGSKIKEFKKYTSKNTVLRNEADYYESVKDIDNIIIESNELNDRVTPIIVVVSSILLWAGVSIYGNYFM